VDPADDAQEIIDFCQNYIVEGILVTHHHSDHIGALLELENYYHLKHNNFDFENFVWEVIKTPGHTDDSISFYFPEEKVLLSGDFLFKDTIGRCDFPNSSVYAMKNSLNEISKLPDDVIVYPGHGDKTILGKEKKHFKFYF